MGPLHTAAADGSLTGITPEGDTLRVREVWEDNLEDEMQVSLGFLFLSKIISSLVHSGHSLTICLSRCRGAVN